MSYILEALRKAEEQRELGQVPGIGSVHEPASPGPGRRWPWLLAAILIVNAAIIGVLFWPAGDIEMPAGHDTAGPADPMVRPTDKVPPGKAEPMAKPAPERESKTPTLPETVGASPQQPSLAKAEVAAKPLKPLPAPTVSVQASPPAKPVTRASVEEKSLKALPAPKAPPQTSPPAKPEQRAADALTPPRSQAAETPETAELPVWPLVSDDLYRQINADLDVNVHVYSKNREKSFVFLNMKIYHEGDQLLEGPQLEEITQDGVVLSFRGERFRVPAR